MLVELLKSFCNSFLQKLILATCGGLIFSLIGGNTLAYEVILILTVIDLITGIMVAFQRRVLSSRKGFKSVYKLLLYFMLMIAAHQVTRYIPAFSGFEYVIVAYIAGNEMLSLVENIAKLGVPLPQKLTCRLRDYLDKIPDKTN